MKKEVYLTEQGLSLKKIKENILLKTISDDLIDLFAKSLNKEISKMLVNNDISLKEFECYLEKNDLYTLNEVDVLKIQCRKIEDIYDNSLMKMGCDRFLLNYNKDKNTITVTRILKINEIYFKHFFGLEDVYPSKSYLKLQPEQSLEKRLDSFYYTFAEGKLNQIEKEIKYKFQNGSSAFIKTNSKEIYISSHFKKVAKGSVVKKEMILTCPIDKNILKSHDNNILKMKDFIDICDEVESKYLRTNIYS